uniref:Ninja-family protein n=1 Tax=Solanum tuberosum TaxID=4113 RepID=M1DVV1_SOLTU
MKHARRITGNLYLAGDILEGIFSRLPVKTLLRLKCLCGLQGSVASSVAEVETQQPPTQGNYIAKGKIKNFMLNHMTFVSTRGKRPNGKKTEGLLYACNKKDEMEIVCLCHGDLLNAVEFVEHTGGGL